MKIDRKLNIVIPIDRGDGTTLYIHSTPIRKEVFETYYLVLAKTFAGIQQNGLDPRSAPSVAALILKEIAQKTARGDDSNWFDGDDGVGGKTGLLAEIVRLSNCLVGLPDGGWQTVMLQEALDKGVITGEDKSEAMNLLCFFTVVSLVAPRNDRAIHVNGMAAIYGLEVTSLDFTAWATSFKTRTPDDNTGKKGEPS